MKKKVALCRKNDLVLTILSLCSVFAISIMAAGPVHGDPSSNPHGLVFLNSEKAYLFRYGTTKAWIIDPSTTTEAGFKIGELDLSSYADGDGIPEMETGVIVDGKLFIILQRLDRNAFWAPLNTYVAVFDTSTDTEIDTGSPDAVLGIPLEVKNPLSIQYLEANDTIYVQGAGDFFTPEYSGGIESIDPDTYDTSLILDDGDPYGNISGMAIVSATKGYFVGYAGWGDTTLYTFDPSTGTVGSAVSGLEHKNIAGMESGIYPDKNNMLWVCNQTDARVDILDITTDTIDESVSTVLNPLRVVFCSGPAPAIQTAVVATAAADYSSGAHSIISVDPVGGPRVVQNNLLPTISDISVDSFGGNFYRIEQFNADNVTKFDIAAPDTVIWQYSTNDDPEENDGGGGGGGGGCFISTSAYGL
ncbi:MAG: hypothetical protein KAV87_20400 [Desulfobacteraceae bacterium]|nr:hypothetical protein [Desulfobacteraceae bacterium]